MTVKATTEIEQKFSMINIMFVVSEKKIKDHYLKNDIVR